MIKHIIDAEWFTGHVAVGELASGVGIRQNKQLSVVVQIPTTQAVYRVVSWGELKYEGPDFTAAVEAYNKEA